MVCSKCYESENKHINNIFIFLKIILTIMIIYEIKNTETNTSVKFNIDDENIKINFEPNMY